MKVERTLAVASQPRAVRSVKRERINRSERKNSTKLNEFIEASFEPLNNEQ